MEPERYILWDSKQRGGRPDTMKILKEVYHSWNAESTGYFSHTACVGADRLMFSGLHHIKLHRQHRDDAGLLSPLLYTYIRHADSFDVQGCKEAGIPCFGTLWDF